MISLGIIPGMEIAVENNPRLSAPEPPLLIRLRALYPNMTIAERRVADYILAAAHDVIRSTITEVAMNSEVGVGTVGRLCSKLGYSGFPALKIALASEWTQTDTRQVNGLLLDDSARDILHKTMQIVSAQLQDTADLLNVQALERAAAQIRTASRVTIYTATSIDHAIALQIYQRFLQLRIPTQVLPYLDQQQLHAGNARADEVIIAVVHSGAAPQMLENFQAAGAFTILLSNSLQSDFALAADVSLIAAIRDSGELVRDVAQFSGLHGLVEALYTLLALQNLTPDAAYSLPRRSSTRAALDELRIAVPMLPNTMDPHRVLSIANGRIYPLVFSTLINRDWTGRDWRLIPNLAANWQRLYDRTREIFLRDDVYWHDGQPLTADDVTFTFERLQSRDSALQVARSDFWKLDHVHKLDPHRVQIITTEPDPFLEMRLASHHVAFILPAHHFHAVGPADFSAGNIVGTGPYQLQEWHDSDSMVFAANEAYFGGLPAARTLIIREEADQQQRTQRLLHGDYDLITDVSPDQLAALRDVPQVHTKSEIIGLDYELLFNMQAAPVNCREIRQALSLAIDRQYIIEEIWQGFAVHPRGPQIPGENYYDAERPKIPFNPDRARDLLQRGGYNGETIIIAAIEPDYYILDRAMVETIATMWREMAIRVEVEYFSLHERGDFLRSRDNQFHVFEISAGSYNDMHQRLLGMWGQESDFQRYGLWTPESARRYNEWIDELTTTDDLAARRNIYRKLLDELEYEVPSTPILIPELIYAMRDNLDISPNNFQGLDLTPANFQLLDEGDE